MANILCIAILVSVVNKTKRVWLQKPYSYIYAAKPLNSLIQLFSNGRNIPRDLKGC